MIYDLKCIQGYETIEVEPCRRTLSIAGRHYFLWFPHTLFLTIKSSNSLYCGFLDSPLTTDSQVLFPLIANVYRSFRVCTAYYQDGYSEKGRNLEALMRYFWGAPGTMGAWLGLRILRSLFKTEIEVSHAAIVTNSEYAKRKILTTTALQKWSTMSLDEVQTMLRNAPELVNGTRFKHPLKSTIFGRALDYGHT